MGGTVMLADVHETLLLAARDMHMQQKHIANCRLPQNLGKILFSSPTTNHTKISIHAPHAKRPNPQEPTSTPPTHISRPLNHLPLLSNALHHPIQPRLDNHTTHNHLPKNGM